MVVAAIVAIVFAYYAIEYIVVPIFTPKPPPPGPGVSLSPSTDISGATITLIAKDLSANHTVSATFDNQSLVLTGSCVTDSKGNLTGGCTFIVPTSAAGTRHNVTLTDGTYSPSTAFSVPEFTPPLSSVLVTLTSVALGLVTQLVTRRLVDLDKERRMRAEVNAFNKEKRGLLTELDKLKRQDQSRAVQDQAKQAQAKLDKLKKRELQVRNDQARLSTDRLKVTGITFAPLIAVYYLMASFLGGFNVVVGYTPIQIPFIAGTASAYGGWEVSLFWWYLVSSFVSSTILSKLLHTTTS
jgi:uncharacterized membrane protein (DUF106 family)